ncbi:membrane protein of unknown function [Candidatus Hydrogenisulfobacillus filiaventi]|uniref:Uncharacterized protein n=1 Tax=Candidatus Hydrogenisulfobacillus filiaventi TaxID=2707344 RepID=A0A6F8ZFG0_9FIRM|nr:hypothetical protein [Bacillota bacterium]CAB1128517.1 membrane protein of unknown function [Candidatus Hydrogenisulfobacillus filiaventi]
MRPGPAWEALRTASLRAGLAFWIWLTAMLAFPMEFPHLGPGTAVAAALVAALTAGFGGTWLEQRWAAALSFLERVVWWTAFVVLLPFLLQFVEHGLAVTVRGALLSGLAVAVTLTAVPPARSPLGDRPAEGGSRP